MKKIRFYLHHRIILYALIVLITIFSACKKTLNTEGTSYSAGLMAFNLIPGNSSVGFAISGNILTLSALFYTNYTGSYLPVYPGNGNIVCYDTHSDSVFANDTANFVIHKYYSIFALGNNGHYSNLFVNDNLDTLSSSAGNAYVRYINAIPDSSKPMITIVSNGNTVISANTSYASISNFTGITPGDITIAIKNDSTFSLNRTITLEKNKAYTVLLSGIPAATDSTKAVQIGYITNGTLNP